MDDWRDIPGFPNYMVNAYGEVYNKAMDSYPTGSTKSGRRQYALRPGDIRLTQSKPKTVFAHQLVAEAFLGVRLKPRQRISHKDGDDLNNHYSNLDIL